ncbi:MAG: hypothetical protein ACFCUM_17005 [Bacteroidales bacterium]
MKIFFILFFVFLVSATGYSQELNMRYAKKIPESLTFQDPLINTTTPLNLDFSFNYLPYMNIGGLGRRLGSEVSLYSTSTWAIESELPSDAIYDERTDYGDINTPIITKPQAKIPLMIDAGFTYNGSRIGLSWFGWSGESSLSGRVPGFNVYDDAGVSEFAYGLVSFWDMGWDLHTSRNYPASWYEGIVFIDEDDSEFYDVSYFPDKGVSKWNVTHESSINSFEFTIEHPVINSDNMNISLIGGIHHGRWKDNLLQTLDIIFHGDLTYVWIEDQWPVNGDTITVQIQQNNIIHNDITLETNSSTEFNPLGILAGVKAELSILPSLSVSLKASTSRLRGDVTYVATGIDIDDIVEDITYLVFAEDGDLIEGAELSGSEFLSGTFDLPETSWSASSASYRLNLSARYEINNMISIMGGYFFSMWRDLPMAPQWSYSDQYTEPYGAFAVENSWNTDIRSDISSSGFMVGVGIRF